MLALDSPRWEQLQHSYSVYRGCVGASNLPALLRRLAAEADHEAFLAAWYELLEAVYREGWGFWSASYAVVPYLIRLCEAVPLRRQAKLLLAVGWIEAVRASRARCGELPPCPEAADLEGEYHEAVRRVPRLIARCAQVAWDPETGLELAAALLLSKGLASIGKGVLRLRNHVFLTCGKCGSYVEVPRPKELAEPGAAAADRPRD
jgi:hypothetical protein